MTVRALRAAAPRRRRLAIALGATGFLCGLAPAASAQPGHTGTGQGAASATVVTALQARQEQDLSFGAIIAGAQASGEVVVSPDGSASYRGAVQPGCSAGTTLCRPHPARFAVSGEPGRSYAIVLPADVMATGQRTGVQLAVSALAARSRNRPDAAGGELDIYGEDTFTIGGLLTVPAGTRADIFRASLPVMIHYD